MHSTRRVLPVLVGLLVLGAAAMIWFWPEGADAITAENYERIEAGMTLGQVEGVLGQPRTGGMYPGDYCFWHGSRVAILVRFDKAGRADWKMYDPQPFPSRLQMVLKKFGLA